MAIRIETDRNSHGDKYRVQIQDAGFGRGNSERGLKLDEALELVRHYFAVPEHVRTGCRWCEKNGK